ncbi:MAG: LysR family transcriptional regulator [Nocardiopsaceae bacterium]|nr:LysR family transcriptional regulator [Nocardiopsaceae bacterium]
MSTVARLRALVAVADSGSVRMAAGRLSVTESAVSAALAALAREVRVPLAERDGRGLRLTAAGASYAEYARKILGLHEEALAAARSGRDPEQGTVRVAAVTTAGEQLLPRQLASFLSAHPTVDLRLEVGSSERMWAMFAAHEADVMIGGKPPAGVADAVIRATRPNLLVVVAAPAVAQVITASDLGAARWLQREAGSATRSHGEALLASLEAEPSRLTLGSSGAVIACAVAGLGATLAPREAVRHHLATGELEEVPVPGTPLRRPWRAVTHRQPPPAAVLLVSHLVADHGWRAPRGAALADSLPVALPAAMVMRGSAVAPGRRGGIGCQLSCRP